MERAWIKTCVKVQFTPSFLIQAEQPQRTSQQGEFLLFIKQIYVAIFSRSEGKKKKLNLNSFLSLVQQSSVLVTSVQTELPVANVSLFISGTVKTVRFQLSTNSFSDVPNIKSLKWCLYFLNRAFGTWVLLPICRVFWVHSVGFYCIGSLKTKCV